MASDNPLLEAYQNPVPLSELGPQPSFDSPADARTNRVTYDLQKATERNERNLKNSLVDKLGLADIPVVGPLLEFDANAMASVWSGSSRVLSTVLTAPIDAISGAAQSSIPGNVVEAYNREQNRTPQPGDAELLNSEAPAVDGISQTFANRLQSINTLRKTSKSIFDGLDISSLVKTDNRDELSDDLRDETAQGAAKIRQGIDKLGSGDYLSGTGDLLHGVVKTAKDAVVEAVQHPSAISEYVAENIPQLAMGAINPASLVVSNAGYGLNEYRDGITDYQAEHNGAMPAPDDLNKMAVSAAGAAVMENVGEMASVKAFLTAGKGGIAHALKEIGDSALKEGITEGVQTKLENNAHLKDTSIEDIVESATIGAAVGGVFGGAGAIGNHGEAAPVRTATDEAFSKAVQLGDVSSLADPASATYDPIKAVAALHASTLRDSSPENTESALNQASDIQSGLESKIADLTEIYTPEAQAQVREQLDTLTAQNDPANAEVIQSLQSVLHDPANPSPAYKAAVEEAAPLQQQLAGVQQLSTRLRTAAAPRGDELDSVVAQAGAPVEQATAETKAATNKVLTLTMENPDGFTLEHINDLVNDTNNSLNPDQRNALKTYSEAQQATENFKSLQGVNSDIINGGKDFRGIPQFREALRTALTAGKLDQANAIVGELAAFAASRVSKAQAIAQAYEQAKADKSRLFIAPDAQGNWAIVPNKIDGAQYVDRTSHKLRDQIAAEADVLTKTATSFDAFIKANGAITPVVSQKVIPAAVTEPATTVEATEEQTDAEPKVDPADGKLDIIRDTPKVGNEGTTDYTGGSMVGKFFDQALSKGKNATARPLVATKRFLSVLLKDTTLANQFLAKPMEPKQEAAVKTFVGFASNAGKHIIAAFPQMKKQGFEFQQYAGSLRNADGSIPQNVVAAVAYGMFNYLNGQGSPFNTDKTINSIMGRDSDDSVSREERDLFGRGEQHSYTASDIGKDIAEALGFKSVPGAPINEQVRLELSLGELGIHALVNMGLAEKVSVTTDEINTVRAASGLELIPSSRGRRYNFIRAKWTQNEQGKWVAHETAQKIREATSGTQAVVSKLFTADKTPKEPTLEPTKFTQDKAKRTDQLIPSTLVSDMKAVAKRAHQIIPSMWNIIENMSTEALHRMNGVDKDAVVHERNAKSAEAKRNQLEDEVNNSIAWVRDTLLQPGRDLETPFYLLPEVWSNQRVGISQNILDPQTNKFARFVVQQTNWNTDYDVNNAEQMTSFKLRVLESFGVKTETNVPDEVIKSEWNKKTQAPEIQAAVAELIKLQNGEQVDENIIVDGVLKGGEKYHTLMALQALAEYQIALDGNGKFTTALIGEGDGINNGPTLAMILFGASNPGLMSKGAIFQNNEFTTFGEYKGQPGAYDVYQGIMAQILQNLSPKNAALITSIEGILGQLSTAEGEIAKAGRDIVKTPLTALVFGSNYDRAVSAMAETFIDNIYAKMEKAVAAEDSKTAIAELVGHVNDLLASVRERKLPANIDAETLLTTEFTADQEIGLREAFTTAIGDAAKAALESQFGDFVETRRVFNNTANSAHAMYDVAYRVLRAQMLKDAPTVTDLKRSSTPMALHDLTRTQQLELRTKLASVAPVINSYMSQLSDQTEAGMFMGKQVSYESTESAYTVQTKMGNSVNVVDSKGNKIDTTSTSTLWGSTGYMGNPGVATGSRVVHSGDSSIASRSYGQHTMLNVHDALAGPDWALGGAMQTMNQNTMDFLTNYSPMFQMQRSYENVILGLSKLMEDPEFAAVATPELKAIFTKRTAKGPVFEGPDKVLHTIIGAAITVDKQKLDLLADVTHVDQYSSNGGTYVVTDADRAAVAKQQEAIKGRNNKEAIAAVKKLTAQIQGKAPVVVTEAPAKAVELVAKKAPVKAKLKVDDSSFQAFKQDIETRAESLQERINESTKALENEFNTLDRNPNMTPAERTRHAELDGNLLSLSGASDIAQGRGTKEAQIRLQKLISPALFVEVMALREDSKAGPVTIESKWGKLGTPVIESNDTLVSAIKSNSNMTGRELTDLVRSQPDASDFTKTLMAAIKRVINPSLKVSYITAKSGPDVNTDAGIEKSRGWYTSDSTGETIFIKSPEFVESGVTVELLAHELTHAAVAKIIDHETELAAANHKYSSPAYMLVKELESLRTQAIKFMGESQAKQFAAAVSNVQEFVAWGMTNEAFQKNVLAKMQVISQQGGNSLVKGLTAFIQKLTGLIFGTQATGKHTGMGLMIQNVSGLFAEAAKGNEKQAAITLKYEDALNSIKRMTTEETYEALGKQTTGVPPSERHDAHLRRLIIGPINKLFGVNGAFKEKFFESQTLTNDDVFLKAMTKGALPFASNALGMSIVLNNQEAFVTEQIEATVAAALELDTSSIIRQSLQRLYTEARIELKGKLAQDKYDYLFGGGTSVGGKSDYLSRFAALGLASEEIRTALGFNTADTSVPLKNMRLGEKLVELFKRMVARIVSLHDKTLPGQFASSRLAGLVENLVDIEGRYKLKMAQEQNSRVNAVEDAINGFGEKVRGFANKVADSKFLTETDNTLLKLTRNTLSTVANDRVGAIAEVMNKMRNIRYPNQQEGILAGTITEMRGNTDANIAADNLLKLAKEAERIRQRMQEATTASVISSFDGQGAYLTPSDRTALTKLFLRTDAQALMDHLGMVDLLAAMQDPKKLTAVQSNLEAQIKALPNGRGMIGLAKDLAHMMVDGRNTSAATVMNTYNIARMYGQSAKATKVNTEQAQLAEELLNPLVSAYAIQYQRELGDSNHKLAMAVADREAKRGDSSGVEMILRLHKQLQEESSQTLFAGSQIHRVQGYLPEIHDNKIDVFAVGKKDLDGFLKRGYRVVGPVQEDPHAPHEEERLMVTRRDSGSDAVLSGTYNTTTNGRRGTNVDAKTVRLNSDDSWVKDKDKRDLLTRKRKLELDSVLTRSDSYDPRKQPMGRAVVVFDTKGAVVDYRYMMGQTNRDALLMRDNNMDTVLGRMAAQNIDKAEVDSQNYNVTSAMYDDYKANYYKDPRAYVTVGLDSTDPELAELYRLLPYQAKQDIKRIWGDNNMSIRADQLNLIMGYRKFSLTQAFDKEARKILGGSSADLNTRNLGEQLFVSFAEKLMGEKAQWRVGKAEDVVQEVNAWIKDTIVVRNISTLVGNIKSNLSIALINGVPLKDIVTNHAIGLQAALDYRRDSKREIQLQQALDIGYVPQGTAEIDNELMIIRDRMARNPIKPLVDAGLMPTIAEDIEANDSPYGYKGRAAAWVDKKLGDGRIKKIASGVLLTHDTQAYKFLSQTTQLSDLISRYVVYNHITTRAKNPLSKAQALLQVENDFVNYDRPSHKMVEYLNSVGVLRFTKYTLRIQKTLMRLMREKPARALASVMLGNAFSHLDQVFESSWVNKVYNPLHLGPTDVADAFMELPAMQLIP